LAIYSETRDNIVETICRVCLHDWVEGTATTGGTASLADTSLGGYATSYFNNKGARIYMRAGAAIGDTRLISAFTTTTGVVAVSPNFSGTVVIGDTFAIIVDYTWNEIVEAINLAINMVAEEAFVWKIDETSVTTVADDFEYDLPANFMYIYRITQADSDGYFYDLPIPPDQYKIVKGGTYPVLHFYNDTDHFDIGDGHSIGNFWANIDFEASRLLRIEGLASPATLSTDSSVCPINPAYVAFQAAAMLHAARIKRADTDPDEHRIQSQIWQARADIERRRIVKMQMPANSKRCME